MSKQLTPSGAIHIRCQRKEPGARGPKSIEALHISITGADNIASFQAMLSQYLAINYPERPKEWRDVADIIEFGSVQG